MISVKWTPVFLKSVMRKNRHAVVLQFEIQATFGDGMGELRSKGTFFLYRNLPDHAFNIKTLCRHNCINAFFRKFL